MSLETVILAIVGPLAAALLALGGRALLAWRAEGIAKAKADAAAEALNKRLADLDAAKMSVLTCNQCHRQQDQILNALANRCGLLERDRETTTAAIEELKESMRDSLADIKESVRDALDGYTTEMRENVQQLSSRVDHLASAMVQRGLLDHYPTNWPPPPSGNGKG